jgi:hypothetical protein
MTLQSLTLLLKQGKSHEPHIDSPFPQEITIRGHGGKWQTRQEESGAHFLKGFL